MGKKLTIASVKEAAAKNAEERLRLLKEVEQVLDEAREQDPYIWNKVDEVDSSFTRKLLRYPGDITTARIAKLLTKLEKKLQE